MLLDSASVVHMELCMVLCIHFVETADHPACKISSCEDETRFYGTFGSIGPGMRAGLCRRQVGVPGLPSQRDKERARE